MLTKIGKNGWLRAAGGAVLLGTGSVELAEQWGLFEFVGFELHHGLIVAGALQALHGVIEVIEGAAELGAEALE